VLLKDKTAVITGSNRGIGLKILEIFSQNGADVIACSRNVDKNFLNKINKLKKKFNNNIFPIKLNLENEDSVKEAFSEINALNLNINILINNAGVIHNALYQMTSIKKLKEIFQVNFFSQTIFTQYILKSMIKKKNGSIVYISSSSAIDSNVGRGAYSASKAALISQSNTLSRELGSSNIRVNTIAPGLTNTDMMRDNTSAEIIKEVTSNLSLKRAAEPNEIANLALFLASDLSSYITGQVIRADGGM
jgi:3-oxoacyl-[acyl-carrier protein] reductase